jgi:hypothetical protein
MSLRDGLEVIICLLCVALAASVSAKVTAAKTRSCPEHVTVQDVTADHFRLKAVPTDYSCAQLLNRFRRSLSTLSLPGGIGPFSSCKQVGKLYRCAGPSPRNPSAQIVVTFRLLLGPEPGR